MYSFTNFILLLTCILSDVTAFNLTTIYTFPQVADASTFLENLAVTSDNYVLFTSPERNTLFRINPANKNPVPESYVTLGNGFNGLLAVREFVPGHFAFIAGNVTLAAQSGNNWHIFTIDTTVNPPLLKSAASNFNSTLLNGMAILESAGPGVILISDSIAGDIWKVDLNTGAKEIMIRDEALTIDPAVEKPVASLGVNGIEIKGSKMFFTNTDRGTFGYVPINLDGSQAGPAVILASQAPQQNGYDDFAVRVPQAGYEEYGQSGRDAFALVSDHPYSVNRIDWGNGAVSQRQFSNNVLGPVGPTSVAFGRGKLSDTAYVTTSDGKLLSFDVRETEL